jgi:hypothetical protein
MEDDTETPSLCVFCSHRGTTVSVSQENEGWAGGPKDYVTCNTWVGINPGFWKVHQCSRFQLLVKEDPKPAPIEPHLDNGPLPTS